MSDLTNRRVGVIGANGFIGSPILHAVIRSGARPHALVGPKTLPPANIPPASCLSCDLCDAEAVKSWASGLDVVIHAAGPPSVRASFEEPEEYVRVHVQGTATVLRACHGAKVGRLIYISSAEVYGRPISNPVGETHRLQARSPYAAAKIGAEKLIEAYSGSLGLNAAILRPFSVYGPHPTPESLFGNITAMAREGKVRLADFRPVRDYCHVDDLASAVLRAGTFDLDGLQIFNVGTGIGTSVGDFARLALSLIEANISPTEDCSRPRPTHSEIFELVADISRAREILEWQPELDLKQGLRRTLQQTTSQV